MRGYLEEGSNKEEISWQLNFLGTNHNKFGQKESKTMCKGWQFPEFDDWLVDCQSVSIRPLFLKTLF